MIKMDIVVVNRFMSCLAVAKRKGAVENRQEASAGSRCDGMSATATALQSKMGY